MRYASLPLSQLSAWARLNAVKLHGVQVIDSISDEGTNDKGGGLVATQNHQPGDVLLTVPGDSVISVAQISRHTKSDKDLRELLEAVGPSFNQNARKTILTFLLMQLTHASPDFDSQVGLAISSTDYVKLLPKHYPLPTFYNEQEREMLNGTSLGNALSQKLRSLDREFEQLKSSTKIIPWCQKLWWDEDNGLLTLEDWKLVDAMYRSRALELPGIGDAMVPVLDMANHASDERCNAKFEVSTDGEVILMARENKSIQQGDEITIMYGCGGASEMIFSYGFLEDGTQDAREMFVSMSMPPDDPLAVAKLRCSNEAPGVRIFTDQKGQIGWESAFVWWACANEEDGLKFELIQTTDGSREIVAQWKGERLDQHAPELRSKLLSDPLCSVFLLRATVLVQQCMEVQGSALAESGDVLQHQDRPEGTRDLVVELAGRLRRLELVMMLSACESLELKKSELMASDTVRSYLGEQQACSGNTEDAADDFS